MNYPLTLLRSELYGVLAVNLIALRMAKTLWSFFGCSECKRGNCPCYSFLSGALYFILLNEA